MTRKSAPAAALGALALLFLTVMPAEAGHIQNRKDHQQQRIARGVAGGQLTARETARLEGREANLNRQIHDMRTANGGSLTPGERALVQHQQNRLSRSIYRQKHDAQTQ